VTAEQLLWGLYGLSGVLLVTVVILVWDRIRWRKARRALKPVGRPRPQSQMLARERGFQEGYRSGVDESYQQGYKVGHRDGFLEGTKAHARIVHERFGIPLDAHYPSAEPEPRRPGRHAD
jgi:hypothetical protein